MAAQGLAFLTQWFRRHGVANPAERAREVLARQQQAQQHSPGHGGQGDTDTDGLTAPPLYAADPAFEAERRAAERGLEDLLTDLKSEKKYARKDFKTTAKDLRKDKRRGLADLLREQRRGTQDIGLKRADVQQRSDRGQADFVSQLQDLSRRFNTLGNTQAQQANAAGVLEGGTLRAAAAKRAQNQAIAEAPIHTAQQRLGEDTAEAMSRLGIDEARLGQDIGTDRTRLRQDIHHDKRLARRDLHRDIVDIRRRKQRGIREQAITDVDLLQQAIYQARQNRPGAFTKTGAPKKRRNR